MPRPGGDSKRHCRRPAAMDGLHADRGIVHQVRCPEDAMGSVLGPPVAHGVLDEEAVEIARIHRRLLEQAALSIDRLDNASPATVNGAGDDGDRRQAESSVGFCGVALQGEARCYPVRFRFLQKAAALRSLQAIIDQIITRLRIRASGASPAALGTRQRPGGPPGSHGPPFR